MQEQPKPKLVLLRNFLLVSPLLRPFSQVAMDNGQDRGQGTKREITLRLEFQKNGSSFPEMLLFKSPLSLEKGGVSLEVTLDWEVCQTTHCTAWCFHLLSCYSFEWLWKAPRDTSMRRAQERFPSLSYKHFPPGFKSNTVHSREATVSQGLGKPARCLGLQGGEWPVKLLTSCLGKRPFSLEQEWGDETTLHEYLSSFHKLNPRCSTAVQTDCTSQTPQHELSAPGSAEQGFSHHQGHPEFGPTTKPSLPSHLPVMHAEPWSGLNGEYGILLFHTI